MWSFITHNIFHVKFHYQACNGTWLFIPPNPVGKGMGIYTLYLTIFFAYFSFELL